MLTVGVPFHSHITSFQHHVQKLTKADKEIPFGYDLFLFLKLLF